MSSIDPVVDEELPFTDPAGIKRYVDQRGGMAVVQMRPIKLAHKVGRLAPGPRTEISRSLGRMGIATNGSMSGFTAWTRRWAG